MSDIVCACCPSLWIGISRQEGEYVQQLSGRMWVTWRRARERKMYDRAWVGSGSWGCAMLNE